MKHRRVAAAIACGAVASLLAACSSNAPAASAGGSANSAVSPSESSSTSDTDSAPSASDSDLTIWTISSKGSITAEAFQQIAADFRKKTGITVHFQWQGVNIEQKVVAALNTNDVPDIVYDAGFHLKGILAKNGDTIDLKPLYSKNIIGGTGTLGSAVPKKYYPLVTYQSQYVDVPIEVMGYCFWYNGNSLSKFQPPKTMKQFGATLAKMKSQGRHPLTLDSDIARYDEYVVAGALQRTVGPGGIKKLMMDKTAKSWNSPEVTAALNPLAEFASNGYFLPGYKSSKWPAMQKLWAGGKSDFLYLGGWIPEETHTYKADGFQYNCFNFPTIGSNSNTSVAVSLNGLSILKKAKHIEAAKKFIRFMFNKKEMTLFSNKALMITPRVDVTPPKQLEDLDNMIKNNPLALSVDAIPGHYPDYAKQVLAPMSQKLLQGSVDAKSFISQIQSKQVNYWNTH